MEGLVSDEPGTASAASGITHIINTAAGHGTDVGVLGIAGSGIDQAVADGWEPRTTGSH